MVGKGAPVRLSEKQFQQQVTDLAELYGWRVYHVPDSRRCSAGFPDLVLARRGVVIFAELKVGRNKTSPDQDAWLADLAASGARCRVWYPADWPEIERTLGA